MVHVLKYGLGALDCTRIVGGDSKTLALAELLDEPFGSPSVSFQKPLTKESTLDSERNPALF